eukprot:g12820.t1
MQFVRQCPDGLTKADVTMMKSLLKPPRAIQLCIMGLCMLTSNPAAAKIKTDAEAKKKLRNASFLKQILTLDLSQIPYENWERLTSILKPFKKEPTSKTLIGRVHGFLVQMAKLDAMLLFALQMHLLMAFGSSTTVSLSAVGHFVVNVADANEPPVAYDKSHIRSENAPIGSFIDYYIATDEDTADVLTYTIVNGNEDGVFSVDTADPCFIWLAKSLDYETKPKHVLEVEISDRTCTCTKIKPCFDTTTGVCYGTGYDGTCQSRCHDAKINKYNQKEFSLI